MSKINAQADEIRFLHKILLNHSGAAGTNHSNRITPRIKHELSRPMTIKTFSCCLFSFILLATSLESGAQISPRVAAIFPKGTIVYDNIPYAGDTLQKHRLDIYLPGHHKTNTPVIVWIHGGAWMLNDKYADMSYMTNTIRALIDSGYALASIDYRYSTTAHFPAQIRDCNQAVNYLYDHAGKYGLDKHRIALIGFSAGGHLASLMGLSADNGVKAFFPPGDHRRFSIRCVFDFYGPSNLFMQTANPDTSIVNNRDPVAILLGALPVDRPDLAKLASPVTYVDHNDPPFLIVQGEKDQSVPNTESKVLDSWLRLAGVPQSLIIVPGAPHYGKMFDAAYIRADIFKYLDAYMK